MNERMADDRLQQLLQLLESAAWREANALTVELLRALDAERNYTKSLEGNDPR